jgi:hypothetical protein
MEPVATVGQLLRLSPSALLQTLDPLLTHGEFINIIQTKVYRLTMHVVVILNIFHPFHKYVYIYIYIYIYDI